MVRLRFLAVAMLALVFAGNSSQMGRSAGDSNPQYGGASLSSTNGGAKVSSTDDGPCVIYALSDRGYDSDLGKWIAQTILEMIEPRSWRENGQGGDGALRYYAPKNVLIVKNSAAIQAKVDGFLKDLKKSLPNGSESSFAAGKKSPPASVVPADYRAPAPLPNSSPVPEASSYPVPAPVKPPKHLFHFLIRYEGEGIIDDNVVKCMKAYSESEKTDKSEKEASGTASVPPYAEGSSESPSVIIKSNDRKEKEDKKDDEKEKPSTR